MRVQYQTRSFRFQGYCIMEGARGFPIDGVGQFIYKDHLISFSTRGCDRGACLNEVVIFVRTNDDNWSKQLTDNSGNILLFHTVEEAIDHLNKV